MKKLIVSICAAFCLMAAPLTAVEWGGLLFNDSGITTPNFSEITFSQSNGVSLWVKSPLGNSGLYMSSEVLYKYKLEIAGNETSVFNQVIDLPLFKVYGDLSAGAGVLSINAGRFFYVDSLSAVISQVVDGVSVAYGLPLFKISGFAGYTGLLNGLNVPMAVPPQKENKIYNMAYPYLPVGLSIEFPTLAGNQSLEFNSYFLADLGSASEKNNMLYASAVLSGPVSNTIYYNAGTVFGVVNFKDMMNYSSVSMLIFPTEEISVTAGITFGSAEQGPFVNYLSLSTVSLLSAGRITPKASFTYTTGNMSAGLNGDVMLSYEDKKYSATNTDWNVEFIYNVFSDLQLGLTVNAVIDLTEAKANNFGAKLNISLAF